METFKLDLEEIARKRGLSREEVGAIISAAQHSMRAVSRTFEVIEQGQTQNLKVTRHGLGPLKTPNGPFWHMDFEVNDPWKKYSVIVLCPELADDLTPIFHNTRRLTLRIDSGCETAQKFRDMTCDCDEQLLLAMHSIAKVGEGMIINIPEQDGRGMGLSFKLATLQLQEFLGVNTYEAAYILTNGGEVDKRTYAGVIAILRFLRVSTTTEISLDEPKEISIVTNNPRKESIFKENGYRFTREPVVVPPTQYTIQHLLAKQRFLGHYDLVPGSDAAQEEDSQ